MLPCPTCGANIDAVNDELVIAACGTCGGLFEWPLLPVPAPPLRRPASVVVDRRNGKVRTIRWRSNPAAVLVLVVVVAVSIAGIVSPWLALSTLLGFGSIFWEPLGRALGIHIAPGPVVSIRNGLESTRFAATSIRQPFVRCANRGPVGERYDLCATQPDGTVVTLAAGFPSGLVARSIERELEAALGVEDAPVPGELEGRAPIWVNEAVPPRALRLECPACGTVLKTSDLQLRKGQAVCAGCRNGILIGGPAVAGPRTLAMLPTASVVVDCKPGAFVLDAPFGSDARSRAEPPARPSAVSVGRDVVIWCFNAIVWGRMLFDPVDRSARLVACGVGLLFVVLFLYTKVAARIRVHIRGENGMLDVRVGPSWLRAPRVVPIAEIVQVFVREQPQSWVMDSKEYLQLCVLDRNGRVHPLVGWMGDLREARSLEEQLERILGIEDAPVLGEVEGKTPRQLAGTPSLPGSGNLSLPDASTGGELSVPRAVGALSEPD
jgi:hypothetical protein